MFFRKQNARCRSLPYIVREERSLPSCSARRKRVYCPYRCGESRCVGGVITCAGAKERQLLCTAVFFIFYEQYSISA